MPLTRSEIVALIAANLPDNSSRLITPARHRAVSEAIVAAAILLEDAPWAAAIAAAAASYATAAQGALASTAVQAPDLAAAIAASAAGYATAAQGTLADAAVQAPDLAAAIDAIAPIVEVVTEPPSSPVAGRFYVIAEG
jgi:hypothetical protein